MMIFLSVLLVYIAGAAATFYSLIRWGDMDPDGYDSEALYWISGTWLVTLPIIGIAFSAWYGAQGLIKLAQRDAEKDKSNES
jgi:hypothetical protein